MYRPSNGTWFNLQSKTNYDVNLARTFQWGLSDDIPVSSDYDGDGVTDLAVWRPSTGVWFILLSSSGFANAQVVQWGLTGDVPIVGDYDGDGKADLAVYRPVNGFWFILSSVSGYTTESASTVGFARRPPRSGRLRWRQQDRPRGLASVDRRVVDRDPPAAGPRRFVTFTLGSTGDIPVQGDYDGDGKTDGALYQPSSGTWTIRSSSSGGATASYPFGQSTGTRRHRPISTATARPISSSGVRPTVCGSSHIRPRALRRRASISGD